MATNNPYGLSYVRTLGTSSAVYADGITPFTLASGLNAYKGDIMAADIANATVIPEFIPGAPAPTTYYPTVGVASSFIYRGVTTNGNQTIPSVNYLLTTPLQSGTTVQVNVITDPMAIYRVQSDSQTGLTSAAMFKFFAFGTGVNGSAYTSTNTNYSTWTNAFVGSQSSSTAVSNMVLLSASQSSTFNNASGNTVLMRVIGLADGEVWAPSSGPANTAASYNSVLVQLINSALLKPGSPN